MVLLNMINYPLNRARILAEIKHEGQFYGDEPYMRHVNDVVQEVEPFLDQFGTDVQVVAYLHDTLEDTDLTYEEISSSFGEQIAIYVRLLSDPAGYPKRANRKKALYASFNSAPLEYRIIPAIVKCADRFVNQKESLCTDNERMLLTYYTEFPMFIGIFGSILLQIATSEAEELYKELWSQHYEMGRM